MPRTWNANGAIAIRPSISKVMERLGLSYTKPTYTLAAADPKKQRHFTETTFPELKKLLNEEIDHLLFEDESMIRDYQAIQKTWFLRGKQRIIPTTGKHRGVKLLATVDYETDAHRLARR
ncbi:winged helix-turn-helix domain-containing protein [Paenibacillus larvae]|nr:winged helix-turn-helix domain-containing protein [Paenibacillus larvae]